MYGRGARTVAALALVAALTAVLAGLASCSPAPPPAAGAPRCQPESLPVRLSAPATTSYHVSGWLCADGSPRVVEVLIPGLTYGASYWNFPLDPARYSYVRAATAAGFATLAIDRLGTGTSSHPPAADVTATSEAYALHLIVQRLRSGLPGHGRFGTVVLVGHSYGSDVALREAAAYGDVAGVISTGWLTAGNPAGHLQVRNSYDAAAPDDPKFAHVSLPDGYVTTKPGTRGADFYNTAYASPAVIGEDEVLKETVTSGELASVVVPIPAASTRQIKVPVLLADGQDDNLDCSASLPGVSCASAAALIAREQPNYAPAACLQAFVLPKAGHSINLHPDAPQWFAEANRWVRAYVTHPGCAKTS
ncbi:MAG: alpha/beta hydrolase [Actinobacteria bacterium]|nr:alpha/beta hydrolase [Actinomycetota bacterium]